MGTAHIATVHWWPVLVDRKQFGFGVFTLPAVAPLGAGAQVITVTDKVQTDRGPYSESQDRRKRSIRKFPETGEVIARDIVHNCTETGNRMSAGCHPGIWRVRESMPLLYETDVFEESHLTHRAGEQQVDAEGTGLWRPATDAEAKAMWDEDEAHARAADAAYVEELIAYADSVDERNWRWVSPITKAGAKHYGITRLWNNKAADLAKVPCPRCGEPTYKAAVQCKCGYIIDPLRAAEQEVAQITARALIDERKRNAELLIKRQQREPAQSAA